MQSIAETLDVPVQTSDIRNIQRINTKKPENKPIIVDFTSVLTKEKLIEHCKKFNRTNKLTTSHLHIKGPSKPIFISENLTYKTRRLYFLARDFAKTNDYKYCWTAGGKVYIRKKEGEPTLRLNGEEDIKVLRNELKLWLLVNASSIIAFVIILILCVPIVSLILVIKLILRLIQNLSPIASLTPMLIVTLILMLFFIFILIFFNLFLSLMDKHFTLISQIYSCLYLSYILLTHINTLTLNIEDYLLWGCLQTYTYIFHIQKDCKFVLKCTILPIPFNYDWISC